MAEPVRPHGRAGTPWALILAGGDGVRLRPLTRHVAGDDRPKQFCALIGRDTLWEQTRRRAHLCVAPSTRGQCGDRESRAARPERLAVVPVRGVGWNDL